MNLSVENVSKEIKGQMVLHKINASFTAGRIYGIIGQNGSGKTMLLRTLAGLIRPTEGRVLVDGKTLGEDLSFPENMGILIEKPNFLCYLN